MTLEDVKAVPAVPGVIWFLSLLRVKPLPCTRAFCDVRLTSTIAREMRLAVTLDCPAYAPLRVQNADPF